MSGTYDGIAECAFCVGSGAFCLARVSSTTIEDLFNANDEDLGVAMEASVTQT